MTYYKSTRPDGTSFYDRRTRWSVGETVVIPEAERQTQLCGPGVLHIADAPAEAPVEWPCRLFRVEPGPIVASLGHNHCTYSVKVVEELPAWHALGPMGEQVAWVIERVARLTSSEARRLAAARSAAPPAYADAAASAARADRGAAWAAAWDAVGVAPAKARYAVEDAALAVLTWDLAAPDGPYTTAQRDPLIAPWRDVIGLPEGWA